MCKHDVISIYSASGVYSGSSQDFRSDYRASLKTHSDPETSQWYLTQSGYIASTNEDLLDRAIKLAVSGDQAAFKKFIMSSPDVFLLKGGMRVQLEKSSWPGKIKIRPENSDTSVWTIKEAIE